MINLEALLSWSPVISSAVVALSAGFLLVRTRGQKSAGKEDSPETERILNKLRSLKEQLDPATQITQKFRPSPDARGPAHPGPDEELIQRISHFNDCVEAWCKIAGNYVAVAEMNAKRAKFQQMASDLRSGQRTAGPVALEFESRARDMVKTVLQATDRDIPNHDLPRWQQVDGLVNTLAAAARLAVFKPRINEAFNKGSHRDHRDLGDGRTGGGAKGKISEVIVRGLRSTESDTLREPVFLKAEVVVK